MENFERRIEILPAYDKRNADPKKNYGIHNAELKFFLIGPKGAIQFVVSTGWYLPHVHTELLANGHGSTLKAWATDIGYHSPAPRYEGQEPITDACPILNGQRCYYDGSSLNAEPIFKRMVAEGHEAVWEEMMDWYKQTFEAVPDPQEAR